jgi:hypothetical protein
MDSAVAAVQGSGAVVLEDVWSDEDDAAVQGR